MTCFIFMGVGTDKRGRLVEWVEKASFNRLNKLFEIAASERGYQTLLSTRNLCTVTQVSQPYILNIIPRRMPKNVVFGEHFVLKDLPFFNEAREADAQASQKRLNQREERRQEGTLRRAPGEKHSTPFPPTDSPAEKKRKVSTKGIVIRPSIPSSPLTSSSESSLPKRVPGQYGSGPSVPAFERLALPVEEETSVDQLGSPHPASDDLHLTVVNKPVGEVVGHSRSKPAPPATTLAEEPGVERPCLPPCEPNSLALVPVEGPVMGRPRPPCDLTTGLSGRLQ